MTFSLPEGPPEVRVWSLGRGHPLPGPRREAPPGAAGTGPRETPSQLGGACVSADAPPSHTKGNTCTVRREPPVMTHRGLLGLLGNHICCGFTGRGRVGFGRPPSPLVSMFPVTRKPESSRRRPELRGLSPALGACLQVSRTQTHGAAAWQAVTCGLASGRLGRCPQASNSSHSGTCQRGRRPRL